MVKKLEIAEYSETEAGLSKLREKYTNVQYEVETPNGMALARASRTELRTLRIDLEYKRKEIKAPALERCQTIDSEARRITAEIVSLEDPISVQIKSEEDHKARIKKEKEDAKQERIDAIKGKIEFIKAIPDNHRFSNSATLLSMISEVEDKVLSDSTYQEFMEEAVSAKESIIEVLRQMHKDVYEKEQEDVRLTLEREQLEKEKEEQREKELIAEKKRQAEQDELDRQKEEQRKETEKQEEKLRKKRAEIERKEEEQTKKDLELKLKAEALDKKEESVGLVDIEDVKEAVVIMKGINSGKSNDQFIKLVIRR